MDSENLRDEFEEPDRLIGQAVGAFKITREIGRGGMGRVYLAERADGEFQQTVAVKLIKRGMDTDFILKRFRNERQILATLDHPYIARLLDGGTTAGGLPYFVMEYVKGRPLYDYCDAKRLTVRERLVIFLQICEAVRYAHERKIIHRDLKPGNIIVTSDGMPKLLDFGIAKLLDPNSIHESINPTTGFMKLLTVDYASPEQVCGGEITPASDVYSLGVVLYELLTGHKTYDFKRRRSHYEISRAICEDEPEIPSIAAAKNKNLIGGIVSADESARLRGCDISALQDELSGNLDRIIMKALAKSPEERYASVEAFSDDIGRYLKGAAVLAKAFTGTKKPGVKTADPVTGGDKSIAVLPLKFLNPAMGEDTGDRFFGLGLADTLITRLSGVQRFVVRPTGSILRYGGIDYDPFVAGRELGVEYILDGTILKAGERIRVSIQLLKVADKSTIWAERFDEKVADILYLEDVISSRVAEALIPRLTVEEREGLAKCGTKNPQAFEMYLRGRAFWNSFTPEGFAKAIESYERAVALDPDYALAYAGIADYYSWLGIYGVLPPGECLPKAIEAAERAVALDSTLADAHATLGFAVHAGAYDYARAEYHLTRALELNPNYAYAYAALAIVRYTEGKFEEGLKLAKRAAELDPLTPYNHHNIAWGLYYARRFDESIELYKKLIRDFPEYGLNYYCLSKSFRIVGKNKEAFEQIEKAKRSFGESMFVMLAEAECLAAAGDREKTLEKLAEVDRRSGNTYVSPYQLALVYCYLKDKPKALELLERTLATNEAWLNWLNVEPVFDFLRNEPRFRKIADELKRHISGAVDTDPGTMQSQTDDFLEAETAAYSFAEKRDSSKIYKYLIGAGLLAVAGVLIYLAAANFIFKDPASFSASDAWKENFLSTMTPERLTTSGNEMTAAVSPDGKLIAYVSKQDENQSLFLRPLDSAAPPRQLVPPATVYYAGAVFTPDGKYVYYTTFSQNYAERTLFRINVSEGSPVPEKVLDDVNSAIGFAPDGKRFAYYSFNRQTRLSSLLIAQLDDSDGAVVSTRTLSSQPQPNAFIGNPSFSPDGKKIFYPAAITVEKKQFVNFFIYDLEKNLEEKFSDQAFGDISAAAWRKNAAEIVVSGNERDNTPFQLWLISYPSGEATRLTNDLSSYFGLSIARNASILVTARREKTSNISVLNLNAPERVEQLTHDSDRQNGLFGVNTADGGRFVYVSGNGTDNFIASIGEDGKNAQTLPVKVAKPDSLSVTRDGRYLVFADSINNESVVWRYDLVSGELKQLTPGYSLTPALTPDDKFVIYSANNDQRRLSLFKISINGGEPVQLNRDLAVNPTVSPDGKFIACYLSGEKTGKEWKIAVLPIDGGDPVKVLDPPDTVNLQIPPERPLAWSPDNRWIYYLNDRSGASNIFRIPLEGDAKPEKVTDFTTGRIFDLTVFDRGRRIVFSQGESTSDIVVFQK